MPGRKWAAGEAGVPCFAGAYVDYRNAEGFAREATAARHLGFSGKSCIHPSQIAAANRIFSPSEEEVAEARRIVQAIQGAARSGAGAFGLGGRMIDAASVKRAEQVTELANRIRARDPV